jgi:hypothetical protein
VQQNFRVPFTDECRKKARELGRLLLLNIKEINDAQSPLQIPQPSVNTLIQMTNRVSQLLRLLKFPRFMFQSNNLVS